MEGWTTIMLPDGRAINTANVMNHSLRFEWHERESSEPFKYDEVLHLLLDGDTEEQYKIPRLYSDAPHRVRLELLRGWEFLVSEVRCTNAWSAFVVGYCGKTRQLTGEHHQLVFPWRFRENLEIVFEFVAANRRIWSSKNAAAPRHAMIVLSGLLLKVTS